MGLQWLRCLLVVNTNENFFTKSEFITCTMISAWCGVKARPSLIQGTCPGKGLRFPRVDLFPGNGTIRRAFVSSWRNSYLLNTSPWSTGVPLWVSIDTQGPETRWKKKSGSTILICSSSSKWQWGSEPSGPTGLRWANTLPLATTWQSPRNQQVEALGWFFFFFAFLLLFSFSTLPASKGSVPEKGRRKSPSGGMGHSSYSDNSKASMSYTETPPLILRTLIKENTHTAWILSLADADPVSISCWECMHLKKTTKQW